jgi:hypothetical protein
MSLKLYLIEQDLAQSQTVHPRLIAELESDTLQIGREPAEGGLALDSKSVSRNHGSFIKIDKYWFFKDLGSSNGSWLNGQHLSADKLYLLHSGDEIQLADSFLGIRITQDLRIQPSVLVFSRGDFHSEITLPDSGKVLSLGGAKSDLKLDVDLGSLSQFNIEVRTGILCVYPVSTEHNSTVNGQPLNALVQLKDRDYIENTPYRIIVNTAAAPSDSQVDTFFKARVKELSGWEEEEKTPMRTFFGQVTQKGQITSLDPAGLITASAPKSGKKELLERLYSLEEYAAFIIGFLLILMILAIVLWWFLK